MNNEHNNLVKRKFRWSTIIPCLLGIIQWPVFIAIVMDDSSSLKNSLAFSPKLIYFGIIALGFLSGVIILICLKNKSKDELIITICGMLLCCALPILAAWSYLKNWFYQIINGR